MYTLSNLCLLRSSLYSKILLISKRFSETSPNLSVVIFTCSVISALIFRIIPRKYLAFPMYFDANTTCSSTCSSFVFLFSSVVSGSISSKYNFFDNNLSFLRSLKISLSLSVPEKALNAALNSFEYSIS
ncbi:hypothetical protein C1631_007735 [Chryseobacterium phosphatilyticum]|uniref:Uncharacterized protein n=1 Tax=Chryseobacterium phosphatilyticum TaxID=475075 RepID=A0A316XEU8_9FLAO|nr:hypothetical protein C1631_007735 [Chryseobacterium phosphatilyticum]